MTLLQYIEGLNAKADLMMEQEPGLWMSKYTDDMSYWAEMGVFTVEDFKRNELINGISDASKDLNGCRLRLNWNVMSIDELQNTYDSICNALNRIFEEEGLPDDVEPLPYEEYADLETV